MKKVLLFGGISGFEMLQEYFDFKKIEILGFINNDPSDVGASYNNYRITSVQEGIKMEFDYIIIISVTYQNEMLKQLEELGVCEQKIITSDSLIGKSARFLIAQEMEKYQKERQVFKDAALKKNRDYSIVTMNKHIAQPEVQFYDFPDYLLKGVDFVRLQTIELLAKEVKNRGIDGAIAELGVYKGDLSKFMNAIFSKKEILLFDTFEGFDERDVALEVGLDFSNAKVGHLNDTNENIVLEKLPYPSQATIVKGFFPQSTQNIEDRKYAFVSIDVDLYQPVLEGLEYFYERLEVGGYIIVHDYNFPYYSGVKKAVDEFTEKTGIYGLPISDYHGSIVFVKNRK